jgi:nitrite reductase/ring-hydroxylating ferredoxin subunit
MMDLAEFGSAECGQHGAFFKIETGRCVDGPCKAKSLELVALAIIDGEVCLCGVKLVDGRVVAIDSE